MPLPPSFKCYCLNSLCPSDLETLRLLFIASSEYIGYVAKCASSSAIIAYYITKQGLLPKDAFRIHNYGITLDARRAITMAPSVADEWHNEGVGSLMMNFLLSHLAKTPIQAIVLWGGVQQTNYQALQFYEKWGFKKIGKFERNGFNDDMILVL